MITRTSGSNAVNTLPVTQPMPGNTLVVAERFDSEAANAVAADLQGGPLPVPLKAETLTYH